MSEPRHEPPRPVEPAERATPAGWQPEIVALVCRWCTYAGADLAGTSRLSYPAAVSLVRLPCTGRMSPLFVLKAFEHGADGVLVSGCHPGDCHYVRGNLYARRRFAVFRELLDFVGLDPRRLHFSWVSASEGAKWVRVVEQVTQAVRDAGPVAAPTAPPSLASNPRPENGHEEPDRDSRRAAEERLRERARALLGDATVGVLIGHKRGSLPGQVVPAFVDHAEQADDLVWDSGCFHNLAVYLARRDRGAGRLGVVVKRCDAEGVVALLQEGRLRRDELYLLGVECAGVREDGRLAAKCRGCDGCVPDVCDETIALERPARAAADDPRDAEIAELEALPPHERWAYWQAQFERCIRCYACRAACPLCYCESCIADKHRPQWISPAIDATGNTAWNVIRAFHLAGRCTGCDECARVCPADIRLDLLNRKLGQVVERRFAYTAGRDPGAAPPLTRFDEDDSEEFIL